MPGGINPLAAAPIAVNALTAAALLTSLSAASLSAREINLQSGERQTALVELYTSEGCSSCPRAEKWLSGFRQDKRLWQEIVPVAFHVDYWDGLGWPDRFARPAFSERQRQRAAAAGRSPYTPEIDLNGDEWRGYSRRAIPASGKKVGQLTARADDGKIEVRFSPAAGFAGGEARVVWLGTGLDTAVKRGENAGRKLTHDFVVLSSATAPLSREGENWSANLSNFAPPAEASALAVWVEDDLQPVQAVGGWLDPNKPSEKL